MQQKMTYIFFYSLPNGIKKPNKKHCCFTQVTIGGGGQDGKWSDFPAFLNPSQTKYFVVCMFFPGEKV